MVLTGNLTWSHHSIPFYSPLYPCITHTYTLYTRLYMYYTSYIHRTQKWGDAYTCIYIIYTSYIHLKYALHTPYIHHTVGTDQVVDPWARSAPYPPTYAGRRIAWNDLGEDTGQGRTITGSIRARTMTFRTRRREGA